jgi:hypothetical protein
MTYFVIELQTNADGITGNLVYSYTDKADAEAKYHSVLMAAAKSNVMVHAAIMIDRNGTPIHYEHYVHPAEEPEAVAE